MPNGVSSYLKSWIYPVEEQDDDVQAAEDSFSNRFDVVSTASAVWETTKSNAPPIVWVGMEAAETGYDVTIGYIDMEDHASAVMHALTGTIHFLCACGFKNETISVNNPPDGVSFTINLTNARVFELSDPDWDRDAGTVGAVIDLDDPTLKGAVRIHTDYRGRPQIAASTLMNWTAGGDMGLASAVEVSFDGTHTGYIQLQPGSPDLPESFDQFLLELRALDRLFVESLLDAFESRLAGRGNGTEGILGTGLIFDPEVWVYQYRPGESSVLRPSRIEAMNAVGGPIWPYLSRLPSALREFLYEAAYGGWADDDGAGGAPTAPPKVVDLLASALAHADGAETPTSGHRSEARKRLDDWREMQALDDQRLKRIGKSARTPPLEMGEIENSTYTRLLTDALHRGFLALPSSPGMGPPGLSAGLPELRSRAMVQAQTYLVEFWSSLYVDRARANQALSGLERYLLRVQTMLEGSNYNEDSYWEGWPYRFDQDFSIRDRMAYRETYEEAIAYLKDAVAAVAAFPATGPQPTPSRALAMMEEVGPALATADLLFKWQQSSFYVSVAIAAFIEGVGEGVGDDVGAKLVGLAKTHLRALPHAPLFPSIVGAGAIVGAGKYIYENFVFVAQFCNDPEKFLDDALKSIAGLFDTFRESPRDLFFALGVGVGESAKKEIANLSKQPTSFHFAFEVGVLIGPLLLEILLEMLIQAWIIAPLSKYARKLIIELFDAVPDSSTAAWAAKRGDLVADSYDPDLPPGDRTPGRTDDIVGGGDDVSAPDDIVDTPDDTISTEPDISDRDGPGDTPSMDPDADTSTPTHDTNLQGVRSEMRRQLEKKMPNSVDELGHGVDGLTNADLADLNAVLDEMIDLPGFAHLYDMLTGPDRDDAIKGLLRLQKGLNDIPPDADLPDVSYFAAYLDHMARQSADKNVFVLIGRMDPPLPATKVAACAAPNPNGFPANLPKLIAENFHIRFKDGDTGAARAAFDAAARDLELSEQLRRATDHHLIDAYKTPPPWVDDGIDRPPGSAYSTAIDENAPLPGSVKNGSGASGTQQARLGWIGARLKAWATPGEWAGTPHPVHPDKPGTFEMWVGNAGKRNGYQQSKAGQLGTEVYDDAGWKAEYDKSSIWHGGHLVPHELGGPGVPENLIPQFAGVNLSWVKAWEKEVVEAVRKHGGDVYIKVQVLEYDSNGLPGRLRYELYGRDPASGGPVLIQDPIETPNLSSAEFMLSKPKATEFGHVKGETF